MKLMMKLYLEALCIPGSVNSDVDVITSLAIYVKIDRRLQLPKNFLPRRSVVRREGAATQCSTSRNARLLLVSCQPVTIRQSQADNGVRGRQRLTPAVCRKRCKAAEALGLPK
ncbi:hypothetical protein EVAR_84817_1 [Eumeta japonica]|uniref:Uncharacterized protein n=1 Tax=Eumeta variegata TaxID=151549 RepID=A0A4C1U8Y7_EUMVA|nr:hypothetical protein EVAR_84817_1 [Eumeta japonica]